VAADRGSTADRLITVAAALFRAKGYAATTTRELAEALHLQKGSLYHHIQTKEDLLYRICSESMARLHDEVLHAIAGAGPDDRLRTAIRAHLVAALRDRDMHAVTVLEMRSLGEGRWAEVVERRDAYRHMLAGIVREEQDAGRLRDDIDASVLTLALLDLVNWAIFWYQPAGQLSAQALGDLLATIYLEGALVRAS